MKINESILSGKNVASEPNQALITEENYKETKFISAAVLPDIGGHKIENANFSLEPPGIDARRRSDHNLGEAPTIEVGSEMGLDKNGQVPGQLAMQTIGSYNNTLDAPNQSVEEIRPPNLDEADK